MRLKASKFETKLSMIHSNHIQPDQPSKMQIK